MAKCDYIAMDNFMLFVYSYIDFIAIPLLFFAFYEGRNFGIQSFIHKNSADMGTFAIVMQISNFANAIYLICIIPYLIFTGAIERQIGDGIFLVVGLNLFGVIVNLFFGMLSGALMVLFMELVYPNST